MTHASERSSAVLESYHVVTDLWILERSHRPRSQSRSVQITQGIDVRPAQMHGVFDWEDLAIMKMAYLEACAFFGSGLKPRQKEEIALSILSHARRGVRDPHRLALKGIVAA